MHRIRDYYLHSILPSTQWFGITYRTSKIPNGESSMWGDYHYREVCMYLHRIIQNEPYYAYFNCVKTWLVLSLIFSSLCIHSITTKPWDIEALIKNFAAKGVKGISVWRDTLTGRNIKETGQRIKDLGLDIVSLCRGILSK